MSRPDATQPAIPARAPDSTRRDERGFSLSEMLVASAVFLLVVLAAYQVFDRSNKGYKLGQNQAEMVQSARSAFDQMVNDIRQAGYEFDVDGELTLYPNQPDEALEFMRRRAIVVRANYDFEKELRGREPGLEESNLDVCCPVVTTANDEIVGYALGKPVGTTQPTGTLTMKFDTTGTADTTDNIRRDGYVTRSGNNAGALNNEETVTVSNFELGALDNPPYVLYRFTFNEDGTVNRQPLIDNVRDLEFTYYDGSDTVLVGTMNDGTVVEGSASIWGDDNGQDKGPGRATRWAVQRIKVTLQTMTPDVDLGVIDAANEGNMTDVENYQGKRLFRLEEDIVPPNLGRRGQTDRDINPPEPVRNVQICTGQCGFVRVSWEPGPPEDKIADHIVILCNGECQDDGSNRIATFVVIANFDSVPDPDREYATFTSEEASGIAEGTTIWARVIARNFAGSESECPVSDCPECCRSQSGATVSSTTRTESFSAGAGTGYDSTDVDWPDARPDNATRCLIITDPTNDNYPIANQVTLSLAPPVYTLNRAAGAGSPPNNWTTKSLGSGPEASLTCHREESTPADDTDDPALRTPVENLPRDSGKPNVYVFRVSGSDDWNWGPGVTDPRNFVPQADNLYDFVYMDLTNAIVRYIDNTGQRDWHEPAGRDDQYDDRWEGSLKNNLNPLGGARVIRQPPRAITPGEVFYYRFRTVDLCWDDKRTNNDQDPADGVHNADVGLPENERRKAWSVANQFTNNNVWRQKAMTISPFYPPLIPEGDVTGDRDYPDQSIHDSDDIPSGNDPIDGWAIPAYAIPATTTDGSEYVKPEKPTEFYLAKVNDSATDLLDFGDSSRHDARVVFNSAKRSAPTEAGIDPVAATYTRYRLYRKRATSLHPSGNDMAFAIANGTLLLEYRTKGQQALYYLTLDSMLRGAPSAATNATLRDLGTQVYPADCPDGSENDGTTCYPWMYRLVTVQCSDAALNDGIDTSSGEESEPSRPFVFPCQFYDQIEAVTLNPQRATHPASVAVAVQMQDSAGDPDPGCDGDPNDSTDTQLKSARLLAYRSSGDPNAPGDYIGTSDWIGVSDGSCDVTFNQAAVDKALREYASEALFVAELSDEANNGEASDTGSAGCRVRSDLLGSAGDFGTRILGCDLVCGNDGDSANVFRGGGGTGDRLTTTIPAGSPNTIRITIPKNAECADDPFTLYQLEFDLQHLSGSIPNFLEGVITGGIVGGDFDLPDPSITGDYGDGDANESELAGGDGDMRLRWYQGFCTSGGSCGYPTVRSGTDPLVVELTFDGAACDIVLESFNFRVAVNADGDDDPEQLLCTNRPLSGGGSDPQPPPNDGSLTNPDNGSGGRGPLDDPAGDCSTCTTDCQVCYCPINQNDSDIDMDTDPTATLDDYEDTDDRLTLHFTQSGCATDGCEFTINSVTFGLRCQVSRNCDSGSGGIPIATLRGDRPPELVHGDTTRVDFPWPPNGDATESETDIHYKWNNPPGLSIANGEEFDLVFYFGYFANDTEIYDLKVDFGAPLPFSCGIGGDAPTRCDKPSAVIPLD